MDGTGRVDVVYLFFKNRQFNDFLVTLFKKRKNKNFVIFTLFLYIATLEYISFGNA